MELLAAAGLPPLDIVVAATRNGAAALHDKERGTVAAGKIADLLLLKANPAEDIRNMRMWNCESRTEWSASRPYFTSTMITSRGLCRYWRRGA